MNLEAEQNLLGMAMLDKNCAIKLLEIPESWFLDNRHKMIYREINALVSQNLTVDSIALGNNLLGSSEQKNGLDMTYLMTLESETTSLSHFDGYKSALFRLYKTSCVRNLITRVSSQLNSGTVDVSEIISEMQDSVFELLTDHNESKPEKLEVYMRDLINDLEWQHNNPNQMLGKQTGYKELDETIGGFEAGKVYVIAGRPGMGKTQFAFNLGMRISKQENTVMFSLEMTGKGLAKRAIANAGDINSFLIDGSKLGNNQNQWEKVTQAYVTLKDQNKIYIDETPNLSTAQMRARLKAHELKYGNVGCIIIDHIGLIKKNPKKSETEALAQICHELQGLSKEFNAPVIELAQLNRAVEQRPDKRPMLSDLKQTSAIEEDARVIMFPYRDEYYNPDTQLQGITELIIAKNSDGELKTIGFRHDMGKARYELINDFVMPEPPKQKKGNF